MIACAGGDTIRVAPYATFGTQELSEHAVRALEGRLACLLEHHGMIAVGPSLAKAMWLAVELETIARQYYHTLLIGGPVLLIMLGLIVAELASEGFFDRWRWRP